MRKEVTDALTVRKVVVSYEVPVGSEEDGSLSELLADQTERDTEDLYMKEALKGCVHGLLAKLPERERYVLERERYGLDDGGGRCTTLGNIGEEIGVTRERVRQIQNVALRKLRSLALEANLKYILELSYAPGQEQAVNR